MYFQIIYMLITLFFKVNIDEPDEPSFVMHLYVNL